MPSPRRSAPTRLLAVLMLMSLLAASGLAAAQRTSVLLVLDASGSMFLTLDDGQYRIAAAKDALTTFVTRLPSDPDLDVGLRVYGANVSALDAGACDDSELVVPVAGFDRAGLLQAVRETQAKGATPIAHSLELARGDLAGAQGRAVIVLVTDGAESCGGDVRAAVEALQGLGIDVDLRIIGFALSPAAIASFDGLGTFVNTASAAELAAALGAAVELAEEDAAFAVRVVLTRDGEIATEGARVRLVVAVGDDAFDLAAGADGTFAADVPAGTYRAEVADAYSDAPLVIGGLVVVPDEENAFAFELTPAAEVAMAVEPTEPGAGSSVTISFEGAPSTDRNWITVVPVAAPDGLYLAWTYVDGAVGEAVLRTPDEPGELEARFHLALPEGGSAVIGRSPAFTTRAVAVSIEAPAEVGVGAAFEVRWDGPDEPGDFVTIVPTDAPEGAWASYVNAIDGAPATLVAPAESGSYEVRYVSGQSNLTLAGAPVTVVDVGASLDAPTEVAAGAEFAVAWEGPDNARDYLTIVPAGAPEGAYLSYAYTRSGTPAHLTAPAEPGAYEVRYVLGQGDRTLGSRQITVR